MESSSSSVIPPEAGERSSFSYSKREKRKIEYEDDDEDEYDFIT